MTFRHDEQLQDLVTRFLDSKNLHYGVNPETGGFICHMQPSETYASMPGTIDTLSLVVTVDPDVGGITFTTILPILPESPSRSCIADLIAMVNHENAELRMGAFLIDEDDGTIMFRIGAPYVGDDLPSMETLEFMLDNAVIMWSRVGDRYIDLLVEHRRYEEDGDEDDGEDGDEDDGDGDEDDDDGDSGGLSDRELQAQQRLLNAIFGPDNDVTRDMIGYDDAPEDDGQPPTNPTPRTNAADRRRIRLGDALYRCGVRAQEEHHDRRALIYYREALHVFLDTETSRAHRLRPACLRAACSRSPSRGRRGSRRP